MHVMWNRLRREASRNPFIEYASVFIVGFAVFLFYQSQVGFADPDSFYHMKMAQLFWDQGVVNDFAWLSDFTILNTHFANQHFLYHVLLSPFVAFLPDAVGAKLLTALIGASVATLFASVLRYEKVPWRILWVFALLVSAPWMFRMNLVKGSGAALLLVLGTLWALQRRDRAILFLCALLYPLTHFGFPLFIVMVIAWIFAESAHRLKRYRPRLRFASFWRILSLLLQEMVSAAHLKTLLSGCVGIALGIALHPWFPNNLRFFWDQFVRIGVLNYQDVIRVGGEWYPYAFAELIPNTVFVSLGILLGIVAVFLSLREQRPVTLFAFAMTVLTLLMTLKSRRYVEYYVPMGLLFSASAVGSYVRSRSRHALSMNVARLFYQRRIVHLFLLAYFMVIIPAIVVRDAKKTYNELGSGWTTQNFAAAMTFAKQHLSPGEVLVHSDWDEFPLLFYQNDSQHYVAGLDPTFAYLRDADTYQTWVEITTGTFTGELGKTLITVFHARAAFVAKDHTDMMKLFDRHSDVSRVYEDDEAIIYMLNEP